MANTKISDLTNASALGGTEQLSGVQSGGNVNITPAQIKTYTNTDLGGLLFKVVDIGDWNMDSTDFVNVAHGLADITKMRGIHAVIRTDTSSGIYELAQAPNGGGDGTTQEGWFVTGSTNIQLVRRTGGLFDSTSFDSTGFNRGWVTILYAA